MDVYDPWIDPHAAQHEYGITPIAAPEPGTYDAIIVAVGHQQFRDMGVERVRALGTPNAVLFDVKYLFPAHDVDGRL